MPDAQALWKNRALTSAFQGGDCSAPVFRSTTTTGKPAAWIVARVALAIACACGAFGARSASAAHFFVDGSCVSSGTGTGLACGGGGPFRTIAEGIQAMGPGDTLDIRGAHDGFDGIYFEQMNLQNAAPLGGRAVACTSARPCVIQGCRAPACPADEQPTIRGMTLRADWIPLGGGVHARTMEQTPEPDGQSRDAFEPNMIMQANDFPMTMLAYAGDARTPGPGEWSYAPATHQVFVNPVGGADPAAQIFVPHFTYNVHLLPPTAFLTLQYLAFEGSRGRGIEAGRSAGPNSVVPGLVMSHLVQRYVTRHFILGHVLPGVVIEDSLAELGCRGWSYANPQSDGCFGYRLFNVPGAMVRRNVMRHLGSTGRRRLSGTPGAAAWPCSWCDPPWNDPNHTEISATGIGYQIKQTEGATLEDNVAEDLQDGGLSLDVSRHVAVLRNRVTRAIRAFAMRNFTPTAGCPTLDPAEFCYNSDHLVDGNTFDSVGFGGDITGCAIYLEAVAARANGAGQLAEVSNNTVTNSPTAGICVVNADDATPVSDLNIAHNTLIGMPRGLIVRDATQRVRVRSNLFTSVTTDALLLSAEALPGLSLDGDAVGPGAQCEARWSVPAFSVTIPEVGGTCGALTDFAAAVPPNEESGPDPKAGVGDTTTTTSTFTTTTSTTSTTLPPVTQLGGRKLLLKDKAGQPGKRRVTIVSTDRSELTLGMFAAIRNLITQGGGLRIEAVGGDGFAETYPLPSAQWQLLDPERPGKGIAYADSHGAINTVRFVVGKRLLVRGSGAALGATLGHEPTSVLVRLRIGSRLYCLAFGGSRKAFQANRKLLRTKSAPPATCTP